MAARTIRSTLTRFVLVAGLAVSLLAGSLSLGGATGASAAPRYSCEQAYVLYEIHYNAALIYYAHGDYYC